MAALAVRKLNSGRGLLFARVGFTLFAAMLSLALIGRPLLAQSTHGIGGTWQGTLNAGKPMRIVLKISKPDGNAAKGTIFIIDESPYGIDVQSIALQGSALKFAVSAIDATYEGSFSADGWSLQGTLTLQGKPTPLNLVRATVDTAWAIPEAPKSMAADAKPVFDALTIKPAAGDEGQHIIARVNGRHLQMAGTSLNDVLGFAYGLDPRQIVGGPSWSATSRYDMDGVANVEGQPDIKQVRAMYQALLADRFQLTLHHEKRVLPVYAITVAKGGSKLIRSDSPVGSTSFGADQGAMNITNKTMAEIADLMKYVVERPVVDQTGLTGRYNFVLKWTPDDKPSSDPNAPPGLFTAFQEQLGLKLEAAKSPVDVIVIDHVQPPSAN